MAPVTRPQLDDALVKFEVFVKRHKRMTFWRTEKKTLKKRWVSKPENHATQLLESFLVGSFGERLESFKEIDAGAGRIDLLLLFRGGLRVIVELKMLGSPGYSSTYAFSGKKQITHYMDNCECRLGYLVIFDGRTRDFGKFPESHDAGPIKLGTNLICTRIVDVRNAVVQLDEPDGEE